MNSSNQQKKYKWIGLTLMGAIILCALGVFLLMPIGYPVTKEKHDLFSLISSMYPVKSEANKCWNQQKTLPETCQMAADAAQAASTNGRTLFITSHGQILGIIDKGSVVVLLSPSTSGSNLNWTCETYPAKVSPKACKPLE